MHKLVAAGIIAPVETRKKGKRYEELYVPTAETFKVRYDPESPKSRELLRQVFRTVVRLTGQDGDASIAGGW